MNVGEMPDPRAQDYGFNRYQHETMRTAGDVGDNDIVYTALGLVGETGEVVDYLKKVWYHGHELNPDRLVEELGDVLWYLSVMAAHHGIALSDVARRNIDKLRERYPEGFDPQRSQQR